RGAGTTVPRRPDQCRLDTDARPDQARAATQASGGVQPEHRPRPGALRRAGRRAGAIDPCRLGGARAVGCAQSFTGLYRARTGLVAVGSAVSSGRTVAPPLAACRLARGGDVAGALGPAGGFGATR